ncbi:MAG: CidA/LrgA family protein [Lachnospiraceae bacterium]
MKYIKQFSIILTISFVGEVCNYFIPLPVPASIYGLVILFAGLFFGWIKLDSVRETGKFLIEIMPLMFIPAAVGLLESWGVLKPICIPVIGITLVTTIIVMVVTGKITQLVIRSENRTQEKEVGVNE